MSEFDLLCGDCRSLLPMLDAGSVQCVVTSPPYFGLRDYGIPDQLGLESTPDLYIIALVDVFREIRRVLKDDGTVWLNLGDSYANDAKWGGATSGKHVTTLHGATNIGRAKTHTGMKSKDLIGIPWSVAFALRADGWYLRSDIIWHKPNPMPESVTDRPTKSHEYLFLLTKAERYYYNADTIKEPVTGGSHARGSGINPKARVNAMGSRQNESFSGAISGLVAERNKRSVWTVSTQPYSGAHFATMPELLVEPCILAGSKPGDLILDHFCGSGTVGATALHHGRRFIGIDANPEYILLAYDRITTGAKRLGKGAA